jgi:hypothetical protein
MSILVIIIMENFEGTRPIAILMRYTGEEKKEEREEAAKHVKGLWGKAKETMSSKKSHRTLLSKISLSVRLVSLEM